MDNRILIYENASDKATEAISFTLPKCLLVEKSRVQFHKGIFKKPSNWCRVRMRIRFLGKWDKTPVPDRLKEPANRHIGWLDFAAEMNFNFNLTYIHRLVQPVLVGKPLAAFAVNFKNVNSTTHMTQLLHCVGEGDECEVLELESVVSVR
jgi:hypothetical protein